MIPVTNSCCLVLQDHAHLAASSLTSCLAVSTPTNTKNLQSPPTRATACHSPRHPSITISSRHLHYLLLLKLKIFYSIQPAESVVCFWVHNACTAAAHLHISFCALLLYEHLFAPLIWFVYVDYSCLSFICEFVYPVGDVPPSCPLLSVILTHDH